MLISLAFMNYCEGQGLVNKMKRLLRFLKDEEGVAEIEYGMIAALITIVIIVAVATIVAKRLRKRPGDGARSG